LRHVPLDGGMFPYDEYRAARAAHQVAIGTLEPTTYQLQAWLSAEISFASALGFRLLTSANGVLTDAAYSLSVAIRIAQVLAVEREQASLLYSQKQELVKAA